MNEYYSPSIFQLGMDALRKVSQEPKNPIAASTDFTVNGNHIEIMASSKSVSALEILETHKPKQPRKRWELGY